MILIYSFHILKIKNHRFPAITKNHRFLAITKNHRFLAITKNHRFLAITKNHRFLAIAMEKEVLTPRPTIKVPPSPFPDIESGTQCNERVLWKTFFINETHRVILNEIIGMGCQGNVYTGISSIYGDVAVKEMNHVFFPDIHYKAEALGIGPVIYDVYYETNKTYIVMEKMVRTLTLKDMETYNQTLCEALTVLIENGIFHNDLRDTNVMFDRYNKLRIIDYDSAVLAYEGEDDILVPVISFKEYKDLMKRNYYIFISERRYVLNYHFILQNRHHKATDKYSDMLYERCF